MSSTVWDLPHAPLRPWPGPTGHADYVVVGLGGSGLAAVHRLLDAGRQVTGLDAGSIGHTAAGRNGGFLLSGLATFHHHSRARWGTELTRALHRQTIDAIGAMRAETPTAIRLTGSLRRAADDAERGDIADHAAALLEDGFAAELVNGALRIPDDGVFHPRERLDLRAEAALRRGAWLFGDTPVLDVRPGEVLTPRGRLTCDKVIVAVDGGLERLVPVLSGRVRTVRLQMLGTEPARDVTIHGAVYYRRGIDYWQQLPDGRIALGGGRDIGGDSEWGAPDEPSPAVQAHLERTLRDVVGTAAEVTLRWAASAGFTDHGRPVLEEVMPGVWVTGGYSGTGNVLGWLGGRAAACGALGAPDRWLECVEAMHRASV